MEFALILRELSARPRLLGVAAIVSVLAATFSVYQPDGLGLKARSLRYSSASTHVMVDTPSSVLGNLNQSFTPLDARATAYANFMTSPAVLGLIGKQLGIQGNQIYAAGPVDPLVPRTVQEPTAIQRNVQITGEADPYRLNFNNDQNLPTIGIFAQAPTSKQAVALANASVRALQQYIAGVESTENIPPKDRVVIRQLGEASGGVVDAGIGKALAGLVFVGVFLLSCVIMLALPRIQNGWRDSARLAEVEGDDQSGGEDPEQARDARTFDDETHRDIPSPMQS